MLNCTLDPLWVCPFTVTTCISSHSRRRDKTKDKTIGGAPGQTYVVYLYPLNEEFEILGENAYLHS